MYRIGVLSTTGAEQGNLIWADLRGHLREYGWAEGKNLVIDWRYAEAKYERLPDLAAELVGLKPDLIMARGGPGATAAKRATATIPIVMYWSYPGFVDGAQLSHYATTGCRCS
jgi:putative ABC transport system substrate-binding protein